VQRWEYAMISNPSSGADGILFSRHQDQSILGEFSAALGRGMKPSSSNTGYIHLNLNHTNTTFVAGLLGERGWELVSHAVLTGGHEYWTFKRVITD
jgi:hypothetical protein